MSTKTYRGRPTLVDPKDPDSEVKYGFDWTAYLAGEAILTSEWIVEGLVNEGDSFEGSQTTILLSGGTQGQRYVVTNRITFSSGAGTETDDRSMIIPVRPL